jgi:hypothetical protein
MSKCNSNGTLSTSSSSVSFNTTTGIATFLNLTINQNGMYTIMISVQTLNSNDYNFVCISHPVLVKGPSDSILTATSDEPDLLLTFSGNYLAQSSESLKKFKAMLYNCILSRYGILIQRSISLYAGSVKAAIGTSGQASAYSNLISDLNSSNFSLANDVILASAIINGQTYNFTNLAASSPSADSSSESLQNAVKYLYSYL